MSMASAAAKNPLLAAIEREAVQLAWAGFEEIKDQTIPVHIRVLGIPININIKLADLRGVMEVVTGETEAQYLHPVDLGEVTPPETTTT